MKLSAIMGTVKRGALIAVEGVDRSGKSTQCKKLVESLNKKNIPAELMVFPDRTTHTGRLISQYLSDSECKLNDHAIHLLFSANRWENVDKMKRLLFDGVTLILDRYSYSGMAFSAAKSDMDLEWCKQPESGLPKPDLVLLLTLSNEAMKERPGFGNERYETSSMQKRVSDMFYSLTDDYWKVINADDTVEEVHNKLLNETLRKIAEVKTTSLQYLDFSDKNKENDGNYIENNRAIFKAF